jgi:hypothetical protein
LYCYIGLLPLVLAFVAIFKLIRKPYVLIFTLLTVFAFLWGIGKTTQFFTLFWETIPGMKFFRYPVKILFFIEFTLAILAGFGLNYLLNFVKAKRVNLKRFIPWLGLAAVLIVFVDLYFNNFLSIQPVINGKDWFSTPESAKFLQGELEKGYFRIYSHGSNNLDYNLARDVKMQKEFKNLLFIDFNMVYKIPANREWFVLLVDRHTRLNQANAKLDFDKAELSLPAEMKKSLSLQRVKYILSDLPIKDSDFSLVKEIPFSQTVDHYAYVVTDQGIQTTTVPATATWIYENKMVYPHVAIVDQFRVIEDDEKALETILSDDFDPTTEVILDTKPELEIKRGKNKKVTITNYKDQEVSLEVETDEDALVLLADSYYPGWKAWVNGQETEILRANYTFRAIEVKAGKQEVLMRFKPTYFYETSLISAAFLSLTLAGLIFSGLISILKSTKRKPLK